MKKILTALVLLALSSPSFAQKGPSLLVSVTALAGELKNPKVVLLEMRPMDGSAAQYIPGTRLVSMDDIGTPMNHEPGVLMLELPSADVLRAKLAALGVSDDSRIVVYDDGASPMSFPMTTRLVFTLEYLGLGDHTGLLNGGFQAWKKAGLPTTTAIIAAKSGHLTSRPTEPIVADAKLVSSIGTMPGYKLVDARAPVYYKGVEASMGQSGHIPGAVNIPFSDMVDSNGMVDLPKITTLFHDAGIKPGDTVVTYCHIGAQATATLFAARLLGNPVMLYDGSWQGLDHESPWPGRQMKTAACAYIDPYIAGVGLGLVLLAAFVFAGQGIGASGAFSSAIAGAASLGLGPQRAASNAAISPYLVQGLPQPLHDWVLLEVAGIVAGGFASAKLAVEAAEQLMRGNSGIRLFDLRSPFEYQEFHIPGAVQTTVGDLVKVELPHDVPIVVYSAGGAHAAQAWTLLRLKGYCKVFFLREGVYEWMSTVAEPQLASDATAKERTEFERAKVLSHFFGGSATTGVPRSELRQGYWTGSPNDGAPTATVAAVGSSVTTRRRGC